MYWNVDFGEGGCDYEGVTGSSLPPVGARGGGEKRRSGRGKKGVGHARYKRRTE